MKGFLIYAIGPGGKRLVPSSQDYLCDLITSLTRAGYVTITFRASEATDSTRRAYVIDEDYTLPIDTRSKNGNFFSSALDRR